MKREIILTIAILFTFALGSTAQMTTGKVSYAVDISSDSPDMEMAVSMMEDTQMEMFFKDKKTRVEVLMGSMMSVTTIVNGESDDLLMLMDMMGNKIAIVTTVSEMQEQEADLDGGEKETTLVDETKEIAGYKCHKAIVKDANGNETIYWYTKKLAANTAGQSSMDIDLPGLALAFEVNQDGMNMKYSATEVSKDLGKKASELFSIDVPEGYTEMSFEDLMNMGGM